MLLFVKHAWSESHIHALAKSSCILSSMLAFDRESMKTYRHPSNKTILLNLVKISHTPKFLKWD
jgi:hypothetical protein